MTTAEDIMARATARGGQYEVWIGGGVAAFTAAEVGHALAGRLMEDGTFSKLPDGAVRTMLIKYAGGDARDIAELVKDLCDPPAGSWEARAADVATCRAVVAEFMHARRCIGCQGRQTVMRGASVVRCEECEGTGYRPMTAATRARALGIAFTTFRNGPAERFYLAKLRRLVGWEGLGLRRILGKAQR